MNALRLAQLGTCLKRAATWNPLRASANDVFRYIDLSSVDQDTKAIAEAHEIACSAAPSRARQLVSVGDVLVSTVRPNLNGVARVPAELDGSTASTGFCVLRPEPRKIDGGYLFQWVKSAAFISEIVSKATGASYPAVSDRIIFGSQVPLPPLQEQRRIAAILDQAETLRTQRRAALAQLDSLTQSLFLDMFGDPVANPKGWKILRLSDVGSLDRGVSKHRPRNAPELLSGAHPLVQTGDVANCDGYIRSYKTSYSDVGLKQSKMWPAGTLCITIAANIAKTGILTFEACFPDSVVGFQADDPATVEFVRVWLSFLQKALEDAAPESAQKNINLAILRDLRIPAPPLALQQTFATRIHAVEALKATHRAALSQLNALFAALQQQAFAGAL